MTHVTIDFESFSFAGFVIRPNGKLGSLPGCSSQKRGLKATGVYPYVEHWSFRPLLLAWDFHSDYVGSTGQWEWGEPLNVLFPLFAWVRNGGIVEGHNVEFERTVWAWCTRYLGWPTLDIRQLRCSAAKSRAHGLPGALAAVAGVLRTPTQKDADGERLMKLFSIPRNPTKADARYVYMPTDKPDEWVRYKRYNRIDVQAEFEVSQRVPDLTPDELENWFLDQEINARGVQIDTDGVANCIAIYEQAAAKYGAEFRELTGGIEATELAQLQGWLAANGVRLPNMQEETIADALTRLDALDGPAYRALQIRALIGSASVKKLYALDAYGCRDGRVRGLYMFHSTHHGRTGGYGPQPSNLYKGAWHSPAEVETALRVIASRDLAAVEAKYPSMGPLDVINNCMRSLFIAKPGHVLISSDYSAIEAVVLAALAGETWRLDAMRAGHDIYYASLAKLSGNPVEYYKAWRKEHGGQHHPDRQRAKVSELASGYAGWIGAWKKFGADDYFEDDAAIKAAILAWRDASPAIVEFWGGQTRDKFRPSERPELFGLEGAAIRAVQNPGQAFAVGLITFQTGGDVLYMRLPSGRLIAYHEPRLAPATRPYASPWELTLSAASWEGQPGAWVRSDLYGGNLTQNAVGGTARDVQMHGMRNVTRLGYPIVHHTYDETVSEVAEGFGSVAEFESGLNDLPAWAKSWPIVARGGFREKHYGKWE